MTSRKSSSAQVGIKHGFRSGLEESNSDHLQAQGVPVIFEEFKIPYRVEKDCTYTPDFVLPNGIIIESKGRFVTQDRQKHIMIAKQYPELDIRFVFSRAKSRLNKGSKTTYSKWCETKGFRWAEKLIPLEWIREATKPASLARVLALFEAQGKEFPA